MTLHFLARGNSGYVESFDVYTNDPAERLCRSDLLDYEMVK